MTEQQTQQRDTEALILQAAEKEFLGVFESRTALEFLVPHPGLFLAAHEEREHAVLLCVPSGRSGRNAPCQRKGFRENALASCLPQKFMSSRNVLQSKRRKCVKMTTDKAP